ncbi:MAG: hypothetical protein ACFFB3_06690 [Candidatus Hodarchaeota archaeon]
MSLADLEMFEILLGLSSLGVVLSSLFIGFYLIIESRRLPEGESLDFQQLWGGIGIIGLGGAWLGEAVQFLIVLLVGMPLDFVSHSYLIGWALPLAATVWFGLALSLAKKEWRNYGVVMISTISGVFLLTIYLLLPFLDTKVIIQDGTEREKAEWVAEYTIPKDFNLPNHHYLGILGLIVAFYLLIIAGIGGIYLWESSKLQMAEIQWKYRLRGASCLIFCIAAQIEIIWQAHLMRIGGIMHDCPMIAFCVRAVVIGLFHIIWLSFSFPNWFRKTLGLPALIEDEKAPFDSILDIIAEVEEKKFTNP